jgi:hypothetical protein
MGIDGLLELPDPAIAKLPINENQHQISGSALPMGIAHHSSKFFVSFN